MSLLNMFLRDVYEEVCNLADGIEFLLFASFSLIFSLFLPKKRNFRKR